MARAVVDDTDDDDMEGFTDENGDPIVIDDVQLDDEQESFYRTELKKMVNGNDPFGAIPIRALDKNARRRVKYQIRKQEGAGSKAWDVEQINGYALYDLAFPPYNLDHLTDLSVENDTHYACIVLKATNIVGLGYEWSERAKVKLARQAVEEDDEKMSKLSRKLSGVTQNLDEWVDSLNVDEDFNEILYKVWFDVEATGNGYIEIGRNRKGKIGYIGHVPSNNMRVRKFRDGFIQIVQDKLTFFRNFGDTETPDYFGQDPQPNEVIHIKKHSSKSPYYGVPDIIAAMSAVAGDKFASEYNLDYFENKAVPRYALIVKGAKLSAQSERRILEYFRKEVKGKHHGTLYIPVPAAAGSNVDVKLEAIENKVQEGSFEKYRAGNRDSIAMVHRVPRTKLGFSGGVAAAREDDKTFKVQVCKPEQRRVEKKVNRLIREMTDMYDLKLEEYDLLDAETRSRINDRRIRTGESSPNEIRAENGEHPRKGGDKFLDLAADLAAKTELSLAQAGAATKMAEIRTDPGARTGGTKGPAKTSTDGGSTHKQENATPKSQTAEGTGTRGTAQDKGQTKSTRR